MPCWTNDCKTIVFGMQCEKPLMASISPEGGEIHVIGEGHDPSVSPDGKMIAYISKKKGAYHVSTCNFEGMDHKQITFNSNTIGGVFPTWSPDGTQLLYSDLVNGNLEIFKCNSDGSNNKQLTNLKKACTPAAWSPDGKFISFRCTEKPFWIDAEAAKRVYAEGIADMRPVWIMDSDGNNPQIIEPLHYQCAMDGSRPNWLKENKNICII
jgi:TolB protein